MGFFEDSTNVMIAKFVIYYILAFIILYITFNSIRGDVNKTFTLEFVIFASIIGAGIIHIIVHNLLNFN